MSKTPAELFDLTGKAAVVTGGSRGLGREIVRAFAHAGADVMIVSRDIESCKTLAEEVLRETGRRAVPHACHVGRWNEIDELAETAYAELGRVDVLVNNAGMSPVYDSVADVSEALWRKVVDVNLTGPFRLSALIGTRMAEGDGGSIINVSSAAAVSPAATTIPYAAAKAGLNALTVGMSRALGPKVRVNAVMPGVFLTDVSKAWDMDVVDRQTAGFPLRRAGEAEEIVGAMLYLASAASSYTTGSVIAVDGGYAIPPDDLPS